MDGHADALARRHTPLPYHVGSGKGMLLGSEDFTIPIMSGGEGDVMVQGMLTYVILSKGCYLALCSRDVDASFIVRACNSHEDLLAALEGLVGEINKLWKGEWKGDIRTLNTSASLKQVPAIKVVELLRKDFNSWFSLINAHACATRAIYKAKGGK